ncbi:GNAT family N-acetyltransferase [Corynebacterium sp.]|uniref:GNAT family N-acetyltransferase n=1 Tax=Corynebacterium sp. TaxID=1720 RepID=UPI0028A58260|nr:GNAT family N-acetyltransferase [Corynebacterium sp.]
MRHDDVPDGTGGRVHAVAALGAADAGEVLTLQRAAYVSEAQAHDDLRLPPLIQSLEELCDELADPDITALGVREAGRLVGAVRLRLLGRVVELGRLVVAPDRQGYGIGTALLHQAERACPRVDEMRLFTGEHSTANLRLYEGNGYSETGRTSVGNYSLVHLTKVFF